MISSFYAEIDCRTISVPMGSIITSPPRSPHPSFCLPSVLLPASRRSLLRPRFTHSTEPFFHLSAFSPFITPSFPLFPRSTQQVVTPVPLTADLAALHLLVYPHRLKVGSYVPCHVHFVNPAARLMRRKGFNPVAALVLCASSVQDVSPACMHRVSFML